MRILFKISIPVLEGNMAAVKGKLGSTIESIINQQKPEAAYFGEEEGSRTGYIVVDLKNASEIPRYAEPWFLAFNALIEIHPVMTLQDLKNAGASIEAAAKEYGELIAPAAY